MCNGRDRRDAMVEMEAIMPLIPSPSGYKGCYSLTRDCDHGQSCKVFLPTNLIHFINTNI